jgi:hypothetical protein
MVGLRFCNKVALSDSATFFKARAFFALDSCGIDGAI